jgi:hypothetical protein
MVHITRTDTKTKETIFIVEYRTRVEADRFIEAKKKAKLYHSGEVTYNIQEGVFNQSN